MMKWSWINDIDEISFGYDEMDRGFNNNDLRIDDINFGFNDDDFDHVDWILALIMWI